jgi:hypothetical protein
LGVGSGVVGFEFVLLNRDLPAPWLFGHLGSAFVLFDAFDDIWRNEGRNVSMPIMRDVLRFRVWDDLMNWAMARPARRSSTRALFIAS